MHRHGLLISADLADCGSRSSTGSVDSIRRLIVASLVMIAGLKTISVTSGHEAEFERLFAELRERMRLREPGCLLYSLLRSRTDPRAYIVQEQYRDEAALRAHESSSHGAEYFPRIRAILDTIHVEYFDAVVE